MAKCVKVQIDKKQQVSSHTSLPPVVDVCSLYRPFLFSLALICLKTPRTSKRKANQPLYNVYQHCCFCPWWLSLPRTTSFSMSCVCSHFCYCGQNSSVHCFVCLVCLVVPVFRLNSMVRYRSFVIIYSNPKGAPAHNFVSDPQWLYVLYIWISPCVLMCSLWVWNWQTMWLAFYF